MYPPGASTVCARTSEALSPTVIDLLSDAERLSLAKATWNQESGNCTASSQRGRYGAAAGGHIHDLVAVGHLLLHDVGAADR